MYRHYSRPLLASRRLPKPYVRKHVQAFVLNPVAWISLAVIAGALLLVGWASIAGGPTSRLELPGHEPGELTANLQKETPMPAIETRLHLSSPAFQAFGRIPAKYTCDGEDISPALDIAGVPEGTRSLALILDDPDAPHGTWSHWLLWNIPPETTHIEEGQTPVQSVQGTTDFRRTHYGGPCPPSGTHRYRFKLYALDKVLDLPTTTRQKDLEKAIKGHSLAQGELIGTYGRN